MNRTRFGIVIVAAAWVALSQGCTAPEPAASSADGLAERPGPLAPDAPAPEAPAPESASPIASPLPELVLDRRADGARLVGRVLPRLPNSDAELALVLHLVPGDGSIALDVDASLEGARVLDAKFAGDAVVTLGADHVLRAHGAGRPGGTQLDTHAYGPISVVGARVAYVRGEVPDLELARADLSSGEARTLTQNMAPTWSPALTPDGRAIVFVSAAGGSPRFYRIDGEGAPRALPQTTRTPGSPVGPRFEGDLLVFEDELGTAWVDVEEGRIVRSAGGAR